MFKAALSLPLTLALSFSAAATHAGDYASTPEAQAIIKQLAKEGISEAWTAKAISQAERKESILEAMDRPAEKRLNWTGYRKIFLTQARIKNGVTFWNQNEKALARAEAEFGVPAEIIVAIIGVETSYGTNMGSYRIIDSLSTLGFDYPRRGEFFRKELTNFLRLAYKEKFDPASLKGSYAGAMGYGQFMPSSYLDYAVDYSGDGIPDIWDNADDAIGSVANYFKKHGWLVDGVTVLPVNPPADGSWKLSLSDGLKPETPMNTLRAQGLKVPEFLGNEMGNLMAFETDDGVQYWLGMNNFYAISRYNHSRFYSLAVYQLAHAIKNARDNMNAGDKP
ncbi:lytic murein transglycosylase B [Pokkaliibacter sp. CJK22405]|uniref:lytic murein transglycosylase B n=1 Tax=Pokkaliibacter sp. CJK22405 TaxID=3384615 RepID=UPI00398513C6